MRCEIVQLDTPKVQRSSNLFTVTHRFNGWSWMRSSPWPFSFHSTAGAGSNYLHRNSSSL